MKLLVLFCTIFTSFGFLNSASLSPAKYESGNECKTVEIEPDYYNPDGDETMMKKNEESPCQGNDECDEGRHNAPLLATPSQPESQILENIPPYYFYGLRPLQRPFDWNTPWQRTENQFNIFSGFRGVPYNGVQYYVKPSQYTPFNPNPAYIPPAVPTYARRSIPELHRQVYRRPARVIRSREEEDFLAELQHMAMMNNILPTMPFVRSSYNDYPSYGRSSTGEATAMFPASASGCAVPLLFSCSPKITRGIEAKPLPPDYSQIVPLAVPAYEYRKQELNNEDMAEQNSDVIQKNGSELSEHNDDGDNKKGPAMNAIDRALLPKHVGAEKHAVSEKAHVEGVLPAHMTS